MKITERAKAAGRYLRGVADALRGAPQAQTISHPSQLLAEYDARTFAITGANVTPETAMRVSAVRACVDAIAENLGSLPCILYMRGEGDARYRATDHPLYNVLRRRPNLLHTPIEWFSMQQSHSLLRGPAFAKICRVRDRIDELLPIHPDNMRISVQEDGQILYYVRNARGVEVPYEARDIFHFRGPATDGIIARAAVEDGRETIGLAMAQEAYGASSYKHGGTKRIFLSHPGQLTEGAGKRLREQWTEVYGGVQNLGKLVVSEEGMKPEVLSMTAEDLDYLEARHFQIADIARIFRVPLPLIQETEKSTSWGTGIEQIMMGFVTFTLRPWMVRWEQKIAHTLLTEKEGSEVFPEFMAEALLRGDIEKRYRAYGVGRQWGLMNADECRAREGMNPIPNGQGQRFLEPANMTAVGEDKPDQAEARPATPPPQEDDDQ